jgi:hypothetical protein
VKRLRRRGLGAHTAKANKDKKRVKHVHFNEDKIL